MEKRETTSEHEISPKRTSISRETLDEIVKDRERFFLRSLLIPVKNPTNGDRRG